MKYVYTDEEKEEVLKTIDTNAIYRHGEPLGQLARAPAIAFQHMECHALCGLRTNAGQTAQRIDQI